MRPGSYYCVSTPGMVAALIRFGTRNHWNHAGIVGVRYLIEAQPSHGVSVAAKSTYDGVDDLITNDSEVLTIPQVTAIDAKARSLLRTPYNFLDIASLALYSAGIKVKWLARRVMREDRMICSQVVATCYKAAGIDLVPGKQPQEVTPGDLANRIARGNKSA